MLVSDFVQSKVRGVLCDNFCLVGLRCLLVQNSQYFQSGNNLTDATPGSRKLDISYPTNEFVKMAKSWEHFDASTMSIVVRHLKRWGFADFAHETC